MKTTLIITTYERPDYLAATLRSVARQTVQPHEVIVTDDGSGPETARVIAAAAEKMNIIHVWREHDGFRLSRMRNCALVRASGDYIVLTDGDMLLHPLFLADHTALAKPNYYIHGKRILLGASPTRAALEKEDYWPSIMDKDIRKRKYLVRSALLSTLLLVCKRPHHAIGANLSFWRSDAFAVNGFNEDFVGWGGEDNEFARRLINKGLDCRRVLFRALCCHMHHPPHSPDRIRANKKTPRFARDAKVVWCENGLNRHGESDSSVELQGKHAHGAFRSLY